MSSRRSRSCGSRSSRAQAARSRDVIRTPRRRAAWFESLEPRWACAGDLSIGLTTPGDPPGDDGRIEAPVESPSSAPTNRQWFENHSPSAHDDTAVTLEDEPIWIDVLANDSDVDGDLANETMRVFREPAHGRVLVDAATANVRYEPAADYFGTDTFWYVIADRCGNSATAAVTVEVSPVADSLAELRVVAGVNETRGELPRSAAGDRLELTQGDRVRFDAVAASPAGFAPGEPVWIVTVGDRVERTDGVTTLDVEFARYAARGQTTVAVVTPSTGERFVTTIDVVPHPVALGEPRFGQQPPSLWVNSRRMYGTEYFLAATPSAGAPASALRASVDAGDLRILKEVTYAPNSLGAPPENSVTVRGITWTGEVDDDGRIATSHFSLSEADRQRALDTSYDATTRWYWESLAADSPRAGQMVAVKTGWMSYSLAQDGQGFQVVSTNEGLEMRQPYAGISPWKMFAVTPNLIPVGGIAWAEISGTVNITRADAVAGRKTFEVVVYDDDVMLVDNVLHRVRVTLSLPNAEANTVTPFRVVLPVFNRDGKVALTRSSWEQEAELYWEAAALGLTSPIETVTAEA